MQAFKKFVFQELIFSVILGLVAFVLFQTVLKEHYLPVFWILFAILTVFTAIFHYSIVQAGNKELSKFSSKFMVFAGLKMILYLFLIVIYAFSFPQKAKFFLISFFILYVCFTIFEVIITINYFKKK